MVKRNICHTVNTMQRNFTGICNSNGLCVEIGAIYDELIKYSRFRAVKYRLFSAHDEFKREFPAL